MCSVYVLDTSGVGYKVIFGVICLSTKYCDGLAVVPLLDKPAYCDLLIFAKGKSVFSLFVVSQTEA